MSDDYGLPRLGPRDIAAPITRLLRAPLPRQSASRAERWTDTGGSAPRLTPLALSAASLDALAVLGMRALSGKAVEQEMPSILQEIRDAIDLYGEAGWLADPLSYHRTPPTPTMRSVKFQALGRTWDRLQFDSGYEPHPGEPGAARWRTYTANTRVDVRVLRHATPAPWIIALHGSHMGRLRTDAPVFHPVHLHEELGYNVAMPVLPLHGRRSAPSGRIPKALPSVNAMDNVHGLAQAAWDIRSLVRWIRQQDDQPITLYGISLGGYVAALTGSLLQDEPVERILVGIPAVDFPAIFLSHLPPRARRVGWYQEYAQNVVTVHTPISPLALPTPQTPASHLHLYAARHDRVLRPLEQATRLWQHWDRPDIAWFDGGHITSSRKGEVATYVDATLNREATA